MSMRTLRTMIGSFALLAIAVAPGPARAAEPEACQPVRVAEAAKCVQDQVRPLREAKTYNETTTVTDNADHKRTVTFVFEPKCVRDAVPCRIASRSVSALVDCTTATASCP